MSYERWLYPERDICRDYKKGDYDFIAEYVKENQWNLILKWMSGEREEISKSLKYGFLLLKRFETTVMKETFLQAAFAVGTLMGTVQCFEHLLYDGNQETWVKENLFPQAKSVKNLDRIVSTLELYGVMNHTEICTKLNLNESTLTEIMKKVRDFHLIASSKVGKYKLYTLTDDGKRLAKQLRMERQEDSDERELFKKLELYIQNSEDREQARERLREVIDSENKRVRMYISPGDEIIMHADSRKERYQISMVGLFDEDDARFRRVISLGGKRLNVGEEQSDELVREEVV